MLGRRKRDGKKELEALRAVADYQRAEAWSLLSEAKRAAVVLRTSREINHYGTALDRLFRRNK